MKTNSNDDNIDKISSINSSGNYHKLDKQDHPSTNKEIIVNKFPLLANPHKAHLPHKIDYNRIIKKENFSNVSELIKCKICFNILINPYDCETCGNTFCNDCISTLQHNNKQCLFKCENFQITPSSFGITSLLSTLTFECLNKDSGCNAVIAYHDVINHDKECSYQFAICPNFKCNRSIKRQLLEYHIRKECQFTLFKCENCEMNLIRADYLQHVKSCKLIEDIFDSKSPIICTEDQIDLQEISLKNFMRIMLYNMSKSNKEFDKRLTSLSEEVKSIKEVINRQTNNTMILIENLHGELDYINERLISHDLHSVLNEKNPNINVSTIVDDNLKHTVESGNSISMNVHNESKTSSNNSSICANPAENNKQSSTLNTKATTGNNITQISNVKKIKIETKSKATPTLVNNNKNKSPFGRSPNPRSPTARSANQKEKTLYLETESSHSRTGNMTLLKSTLRNQEVILDNLNKLIERVNIQENVLNKKMETHSDELKDFIKFFLIEKNDYEY